ncbi:hypothetical protein TCE0_042f15312 [Talaromyces pinophilus]|uniref:Uncharacterized protein n=1 Tax=Talaromyces pinophilus TaxID=128442 RepID=A0A6V8HJT1_TALPI|nr:hypothetical protein TCE0_042f15312 [Talaromyces pinophilus]
MSDGRLLVNRRCIYERKLPGDAYVTAHAERLQHGYFSSKNTSDPEIAHVDFLAVNFVMHPGDTGKHRFKSATIKASIQNSPLGTDNPYPYPQENPRFLMHAPHLIYGAVSPETLQWTFSLAGSLGISESPILASVTPSGTRSASYKIYEMMKIQGSCRTLRSRDGPEFDVEDGEVVWSLTENGLQRSGLPREFTFVMLIHKPSADSKITFKLDIDPVIDAWYGKYPAWWINRPSYQPLHKRAVNFRTEFGQRFTPVEDSEKGFNFATLAQSLDDYVNMPGSTYSSNVSPDGVYNDPNGTKISNPGNPPQSSLPSGDNSNDSDSQPIYIPEYPQNPGYPQYQYPPSQPTYYPPYPNTGRAWPASSPFQRGWPRGEPYYGGPVGNDGNNAESTINVRISLDSAFASNIVAATLGTPIRRPSPFLTASHNMNNPVSSPLSKAPAANGISTMRTKSLRRTKSRDRLDRLSSSPRSLVNTDPAKHDSFYQRQSDHLNYGNTTTDHTSNDLIASPQLDSPTMYEINDTPPPNSIRDPTIVNGHGLDTPSKSTNYDWLANGIKQYTPLTNGVQSTTPPSSGIQRMRNGMGTGHLRRRSASYAQNGYQNQYNRYSYPVVSSEDDPEMF